MIIRISFSQYEFLMRKVLADREQLINKLSDVKIIGGRFEIDVSEDAASDIRDVCLELLEVVGFNEKDELTQHGRKLEELSDVFHN